MERVIVAVDRSDASLRAVDLAAEIAGKYNASLLLLTVVSGVFRPDPGIEAFADIEHIKERRSRGQSRACAMACRRCVIGRLREAPKMSRSRFSLAMLPRKFWEMQRVAKWTSSSWVVAGTADLQACCLAA